MNGAWENIPSVERWALLGFGFEGRKSEGRNNKNRTKKLRRAFSDNRVLTAFMVKIEEFENWSNFKC